MTRFLAVAYVAMAALLAPWAASAQAVDEPVVLVATRALRDQLYGASVLIATPMRNGQHIGFILNRPTRMKLGEMFPDHAPSRKVVQPIYLGGPESPNVLFAVVQRDQRAGGIRLAADIYLEMDREQVDRVIERENDHARFFAGVVVWRRGELDAEIRNHYWYVEDADAEILLREPTTGLWEELVKRGERNKNAVTTRAFQ
jgi:putative transcriptional regulator